jgi:DNA-binding transcriptional ArsR family regulator
MHDDVRLADIAIAADRMLIELLHLIWFVGYAGEGKHPGSSMELMLVSMATAIATQDGDPMTASEIAKKLGMPRSNVDRHLKRLVATGRVHLDQRRYVHDLDQLDQLMGSLANFDRAVEIVQACLTEWERLRPLLIDRMAMVFVGVGSSPWIDLLDIYEKARITPGLLVS